MGSDNHYGVPDPKARNWRVAFKRWLARVLGVKGGLSITIPPGATLIMPPDSVVEVANIAGGSLRYVDATGHSRILTAVMGGEVRYAAADLQKDIAEGRAVVTPIFDRHGGMLASSIDSPTPKAAGENRPAPTHRRPDPPPAPPEKRYG